MKGNMSQMGLTTSMLISHAEINHGQRRSAHSCFGDPHVFVARGEYWVCSAKYEVQRAVGQMTCVLHIK